MYGWGNAIAHACCTLGPQVWVLLTPFFICAWPLELTALAMRVSVCVPSCVFVCCWQGRDEVAYESFPAPEVPSIMRDDPIN